jgi:hypothetical protein
MAAVTIKHSGDAIAADTKKCTVTDKRGRVLTLEEPNFLSEFRLMEAVGPELASNAAWMASFGPLTYISEIDGQKVFLPTNKVQAEAFIQQVGRDGYAAVFEGLKEHFAASKEDLDFAKN